MASYGDMFPVTYGETSPAHPPLALDWTQRTEEPTMTKDADFVYVDIHGDEVARDDPAAQTKYAPDELKRLRAGGFFPKRDGDADADETADQSEGTPVLNSGIEKVADVPLTPAVGDARDAAADDDDKPHARHARK